MVRTSKFREQIDPSSSTTGRYHRSLYRYEKIDLDVEVQGLRTTSES